MAGRWTRWWAGMEEWWARRDSERFAAWLRRQGVAVGEGSRFFGIRQIHIDLTRPCLVTIGNNVVLTRGVTILTHGYDWMVLRNRYGQVLGSSGPVTIEDNVFVGMNATILKGVRIGPHAIVGAGSVVTRDVPPETVVAGNPARVVCTLDEYYEKRKERHVAEALAYARAIRERLGRDPVPADFREEFPLFLGPGETHPDIPVRAQLGPAWDKYEKSHVPRYRDFQEFLRAAGIQR